jgi:hypothetical protein
MGEEIASGVTGGHQAAWNNQRKSFRSYGPIPFSPRS